MVKYNNVRIIISKSKDKKSLALYQKLWMMMKTRNHTMTPIKIEIIMEWITLINNNNMKCSKSRLTSSNMNSNSNNRTMHSIMMYRMDNLIRLRLQIPIVNQIWIWKNRTKTINRKSNHLKRLKNLIMQTKMNRTDQAQLMMNKMKLLLMKILMKVKMIENPLSSLDYI